MGIGNDPSDSIIRIGLIVFLCVRLRYGVDKERMKMVCSHNEVLHGNQMERFSWQQIHNSHSKLEIRNTRKEWNCSVGTCEKKTRGGEQNSGNYQPFKSGESRSIPWKVTEAFSAFSIPYLVTLWFEVSIMNKFTDEKYGFRNLLGFFWGHKDRKQ